MNAANGNSLLLGSVGACSNSAAAVKTPQGGARALPGLIMRVMQVASMPDQM